MVAATQPPLIAPGTHVDVALPLPLQQAFTYALPSDHGAHPGTRVRVTFGRQKLVGVVLGPTTRGPATRGAAGRAPIRVRTVDAVLDATPLLDSAQLSLARGLSDYYLAPIGECAALLLPPRMADGEEAPEARTQRLVTHVANPPADARLGAKMVAVMAWLEAHHEASAETVRAATGATPDTLKRLAAKGWIRLRDEETHRDPLRGVNLANLGTHAGVSLDLTAEQSHAVETIAESFGTYRGFLLHGVTGSGKTEVYLTLIRRALDRGQGAIVVVPEIALTPQLVARFRTRLGDRIAIQHSGLDPMARHEQWLRIRSGDLPVVVGARSAIFAPVPDPAVIIVDEEHEPSFKQENSPRYHGRDVALVRGHFANIPVVLGSATPSLETWANVGRHKLTRIALTQRATHGERPLPEVSLVDMRERLTADGEGIFSNDLRDALASTIEAGEQALLFVNRRGYASSIQCRACGHTLACDHCSVTYTWHRRRERLVCHYCDARRRLPPTCPACGHHELGEIGFGTEQVESVLMTLLPDARIGRMDRDTTRGHALLRLLTRFRKHELDILVGTQMLAKGHDFPKVTLVGVLLAEQGLAFPDFRASERTFHLLTQISGRAGRGDRPGRVIVQTRQPDHPTIRYAMNHDAIGFLESEQLIRDLRGFPPASHLALFRLQGNDEGHTRLAAERIRAALEQHRPDDGTVIVHPAQPAPIERIQDRFRFQVLCRASQRRGLRAALEGARHVWADARAFPGVQVALDVDPYNFL
jgi:primosomal protein N' (replication factor Y)